MPTTREMRQTGLTGRQFGVELEMFCADPAALVSGLAAAGVACRQEPYNHETRPHWKLVPDGSVQDPVTGTPWIIEGGVRLQACELVSPPLAGEAGLATIERVCGVLARVGARINRTCGLHVHHDAADLDVRQLVTLARLTHRFERVLDGLVAPSRRPNPARRFCGGFEAGEMLAIGRARTRASLAGMDRRRNLNLAALARHGTVEWRQHGGTIEADKIIGWALLTQGLVEAAAAGLRVGRAQLAGTLDGLDGLIRTAGLVTCRPHGHEVAPACAARVQAVRRLLADRARKFGILAARRTRTAAMATTTINPATAVA